MQKCTKILINSGKWQIFSIILSIYFFIKFFVEFVKIEQFCGKNSKIRKNNFFYQTLREKHVCNKKKWLKMNFRSCNFKIKLQEGKLSLSICKLVIMNTQQISKYFRIPAIQIYIHLNSQYFFIYTKLQME